jgi:hypothetical protein
MPTPSEGPGFNVSGNKGFQITFENGWTISVQFGVFNYCEHYHSGYNFGDEQKQETWKSENAEIAVFHNDLSKPWYSFGSDTVKGYCSSGEVAMWIGKVASWN